MLLCLAFVSLNLSAQNEFITVWKTDMVTAGNATIRFRAEGSNFTFEWEEVGNPANNGSTTKTPNSSSFLVSHTFPSAGTYRVKISPGAGTFSRFYYRYPYHQLLLDVEQWGNIAWTSMGDAFNGAYNMTMSATDAPNLTGVTDFGGMFYEATSFNSNINHWNVSSGTNFKGMFIGATSFNQPLNNWNVSSGISFRVMFYEATSFNQPLNNWNVSSGTNFGGMFYGATSFNQPLNNWNVSSGIDFSHMFYGATSFNQPLNNWNVSSGISFRVMFYGATSFNQSLENWNLASVYEATWCGTITGVGGSGLTRLFQETNMSKANYDNTLIGWENNPSTKNGLTICGNNLSYCASEAARNTLRTTKSWLFGQDTKVCPALTAPSGSTTPTITGGYTAAQEAYGQPITLKIMDTNGVVVHTQTYPATQTTFSYTVPTALTQIHYKAQIVTEHTTSRPATVTREYVLAEKFFTTDGSTPLPVELTHFTAQEHQKTTLLTWATASERNNAYFVVERSDDAINWQEVKQVAGAGNNTTTLNYSAVDYAPLKGKSYYRLAQYDFNGAVHFSDIEAVYFAEEKSVSIFPNPTSGAEINLQLDGFNNQKATVSINDISGTTHFLQEIVVHSNSEEVNLPANLAKGVYLVVVKSKGASYTERLIVR